MAISIKAEYTHTLCPNNSTQLYTYPTEMCTDMFSKDMYKNVHGNMISNQKQSTCPSMPPELIKISYSPKLQGSEPPCGIPQSVGNRSQWINASLLSPHPWKTLRSIMYPISVTHLYIGFFFLTVSLFHFFTSPVSWIHSPNKLRPNASPRGSPNLRSTIPSTYSSQRGHL